MENRTTDDNQVLVVHPDGTVLLSPLPANPSDYRTWLRETVGCTVLAAVSMARDWTLWLDDSGLVNGSPPNPVARAVVAAHRDPHDAYAGTCVLSGTCADGHIAGLPQAVRERLVDIAAGITATPAATAQTQVPAVLEHGLGSALPAGTATAWGCRATAGQDGCVTVPADRVSCTGPRAADLLAHLTPQVEAAWRDTASRLLASGRMSLRRGGAVQLHRDDAVTVLGDTRGSHGHLYVCAYFHDTGQAHA